MHNDFNVTEFQRAILRNVFTQMADELDTDDPLASARQAILDLQDAATSMEALNALISREAENLQSSPSAGR